MATARLTARRHEKPTMRPTWEERMVLPKGGVSSAGPKPSTTSPDPELGHVRDSAHAPVYMQRASPCVPAAER
jgi:hypothetical protein